MVNPSPTSFSLSEISGSGLREICGEKPAVLVGSGISLFAPTMLPSGMLFGSKLHDFLFTPEIMASAGSLKSILKSRFEDPPFEALMECYPDQERLPFIISKLYSTAEPNDMHKALVRALALGRISSLITTNYDLALDNCIETEDPIATVFDEKGARSYLERI